MPWKKEDEIIGKHASYEQVFSEHKKTILEKMAQYEPMSAVLEEAMQEYDEQQKVESIDSGDTEVQGVYDEQQGRSSGEQQNENRDFIDIGPFLGVCQVHNNDDDIELNTATVSDDEYLAMLSQLNTKQQEFHMHIMHKALQNSDQVLYALHGRAGTGKSTVIHAVYHGLNRILNKQAGSDYAIQHVLLAAPTGKAAYNIKQTTIHQAFFIAANQKLEYKQLSWDNRNTARAKFSGKTWVIIDEFSMVGNAMLKILHLHSQEIHGNQLPFGGLNIICVGDLHQLQPVMQSYIFADIDVDYGTLATNLWKEYFTIFELTEIMRQKGD